MLAGMLLAPVAPRSAVAADRPMSGELSRALENLRNSDGEWRREDTAYRRQRAAGSLSAEDAAEYAEFVAGLQRRKLENCETVREIGGEAALTGYDCVLTAKSASAPAALLPPETARTDAEKLEGLEAELKRLEAELDDELRRKQQALRERQQNQSGGGGDAAGSRQGGGEGGVSGGATGDTAGKAGSTAKWSNPDGEKPARTGTASPPDDAQTAGSPGDSGQLPPETGTPGPGGQSGPGAGRSTDREANPATAATGGSDDGSDDDIVMRQIREAAERETDPVMKEKLWAEYRKLKAAKR